MPPLQRPARRLRQLDERRQRLHAISFTVPRKLASLIPFADISKPLGKLVDHLVDYEKEANRLSR